MAGTGVIEDFVSDKAFQQLEQVETYLSALNITLVEGIKNAKAYSDALAGAKGFKDISTNANSAARELRTLNTVQNETISTQQKITKAEAERNRLAEKRKRIVQESTATEIAAQRQNAAGSAAITRTTNAENEANSRAAASAYARSIQTQAAGRSAQVAAVQISEETAAIETNTAVQATGLANVGRQLTRGLGYLRTLAYVLPGIGIAGIFTLAFEAISQTADKLGFFNSKINQARDTLDALNEVNKQADKQAGEQTTHLKYLYAAATDVSNAMNNRLLAARELQKEFPNTFKNITDENIVLGIAKTQYDLLTDAILKNARAKAAADKIAELESKKLDVDVEIIKTRTAEMSEQRRLAEDIKKGKYDLTGTGEAGGSGILEQDESDKIHKRAVQRVKDLNEVKNGYIGTQRAIEQAVGGKTAIGNAIAGDKDNTPKTPKPKDDRKQILDQQIKDAKLSQDTILADEKTSLEERILTVADYENTVSQLVDKARKAKVITALEESNYFKALDLETGKERKDIADKVNKELQKAFDDGVKNANTALQQEIIDLRDAQDTKLLEIEQYQAEALNATADLYRGGKISVAQYNQQVYDIEKQAAADRINLQIDTLEKILATQKENLSFGIGDPKDVQKTQNLITKLRIDASNLETKVILDNVNKVKEARKSLHDLEKQIADQSIELIQTLVDGSYQRQLDALSAQSDQLTANADKEKEVVDRSLATDEEKANKKNIIDAKTQSQQEVIAQKEREVKTRQAKFDKAISIIKIVEAVGIAEVQALSYLSNPFTAPLYPAIAAAIGALGALQLATVIATPIPKYAKGTDYHKGGAMIVGDAGTELVIEPNGKRYLTPDTDTLTTAPVGTRVLPNHEVIKMLAKPERINYVGGHAVDIQQLVAAQNKTTKAIQGQKMAGTFITKGGWKRQQQQVSNWNSYRNNHFN